MSRVTFKSVLGVSSGYHTNRHSDMIHAWLVGWEARTLLGSQLDVSFHEVHWFKIQGKPTIGRSLRNATCVCNSIGSSASGRLCDNNAQPTSQAIPSGNQYFALPGRSGFESVVTTFLFRPPLLWGETPPHSSYFADNKQLPCAPIHP